MVGRVKGILRFFTHIGELAQLARAPALHAGGQGFDSLILHKLIAEGGLWIADCFYIRNRKSEIRNRTKFFDILETKKLVKLN